MVCDGGGSNSWRKHVFKHDLQALGNTFGISVRVAPSPAYCSKFHPRERRLFCHGTRAGQGVLFDSLQTVIDLMQKTRTRTGWSVTVRVLEKIYEAGRTVAAACKQNMPIVFDTFLPKWNYRVVLQFG